MPIGVDLGGTKIEALALGDSGEELLRRRVPTPKEYGAVLDAIASLVTGFETELRASFPAVGIGTPGALCPDTGLIQNSNSACLIGKPLDKDLSKRLGKPIRLENDANCFALSEATDGAGAGGDVVFGVILGTGVGGGLSIRKRVLTGRNAIAGEWGHNPLPRPDDDERPGPLCYCGRLGCIETFLSGPGLSRDHASRTGERLSGREIDALARRGDAAAETSLDRYEERLARALASVINVVDPDIIVLGGGVSNIERLYERVPRKWTKHIFSDGRPGTLLVPARFGDSSGVRGAAWLAK